MTKEEAIKLAWKTGNLSYKIYPYQKIIYDALHELDATKMYTLYTLLCARQFGKTSLLMLFALEKALSKEYRQIRFVHPTLKNLRKVVRPIIRIFTADAPQEYKPIYDKTEDSYIFPHNGSEIQLAATEEGHAEAARGPYSHLNLIDEAGFMAELQYLIRSILIPQTTKTRGNTIIGSTPAKSPAHEFFEVWQECEKNGNFKTYDIYANKSLSSEAIDAIALACGGKDSDSFRREYLCQWVVDSSLSVVPEFKENCIYKPESLVVNPMYKKFYQTYIAMDIGGRDFTALLFGYWDFERQKLIVEREETLEQNQVTTRNIAEVVLKTTKELNYNLAKTICIADNNNIILLNDLAQEFKIYFNPTTKDSLEAMVAKVRLWADGKIEINEKCAMLIANLKYAFWKENRKEFSRSRVYKHFDHLAAFMYMVRNIDEWTNPIPKNLNWTWAHNKAMPEVNNKALTIFGDN